jgi:hypothetical protein
MDMSKYTPYGATESRQASGFDIRDARGSMIGFVNLGPDRAASAATARMMAAAPELLGALEAAVESGMVPKSTAAEGGASAHSEQVRVADLIRAAIAKATGAAS